MKKISLIIVFCAIAVITSFVIYLNVTRKQSDTLNWSTYTNTNYGFQIQYPDDRELITDKNKATIGFIFSNFSCEKDALACFAYKPEKFPGTNFNGATISVNIARAEDGSTINTSVGCSNYGKDLDVVGTKIINGITFRRVNSSDGAGGHVGSVDDYITFASNQCFDVRIVYETISSTDFGLSKMTPEMERSILDTFEQMLSTFKFILPTK
jgi:hypothetical protein